MKTIFLNSEAGRLLALVTIVLALGITACDITIDAEKTPIATIGTSVFSAVVLRDPDKAIDVVFVGDDDYGDLSDVTNRQAFLDDVADMIDTGFWKNGVYVSNLHLFNYWYMTATGTVEPPTSGICPSVTWPDLTDAAFAEVVVQLHTNELRDCARGRLVTAEPTSFRTVVHEASHAAYGLPDEYCCDGGYWNIPPVLYNNQTDCDADAITAAWRNCQSVVGTGGRGTWWRSEDTTTDIMSGGGSIVLEYGNADWVIVKGILDGLPQSTVNDPPVFAPDEWP